MKLKAVDILNINEGLMCLSEKEMDLATSIAIAENINTLSVSKKVIDDKRDNLILQYADKDENGEPKRDGNNIAITDTKKFTEELNNLLSTEVEVNLLPILKSSISDIKIAPKYILPLIPILKDEE